MPLVAVLEQTGRYIHFAARALPAALLSVRRPADVLQQLYTILIGALPLAGVTGLALGVVVWIHLRDVLPDYLEPELPKYMALAVVLEFAPLGAGLIVAGRSGASLGAEMGSMRLTEQLDALEVLGRSPMDLLVGPRVLACMLTLPILTVYVAFISVGSSWLAEMVGGDMTFAEFQRHTLRGLTPGDMIPATLKTVVFGYLVAVTGCYFGMTAEGGTEGVGRAATRGVVMSIFAVMVSNVFLVKLIQVLTG
jgi:phospholipid/cholesterol/gamma-HCH transport system permease protein